MRGAVDRLVFEAFVQRVLVPTLRPGQIVILDNLSVHKSAKARARIEAAGCQFIFCPPTRGRISTLSQAAELFLSATGQSTPFDEDGTGRRNEPRACGTTALAESAAPEAPAPARPASRLAATSSSVAKLLWSSRPGSRHL